MRLLLVHGINQQGKDPAALKQAWIHDIEAGLGQPGALNGVQVDMPFYGDVLFASTNEAPSGVVAQGPDDAADRELAAFLEEGLSEQADDAGITRAEIRAEQESLPAVRVVEQGFPMDRRLNALVSVLEKVSPWRGRLALKMLGQAHTYLKRPGARKAVDDVVRPDFARGPAVVVGHSLGSVVSFCLLREAAGNGAPIEVPLYITVGSPLTLDAVQKAVGPSFANPGGIGRWLNARDPDDFISLNRSLKPPRYAGPIEDLGDIVNGGADAHAIPGYLAHPGLARAIADGLGLH